MESLPIRRDKNEMIGTVEGTNLIYSRSENFFYINGNVIDSAYFFNFLDESLHEESVDKDYDVEVDGVFEGDEIVKITHLKISKEKKSVFFARNVLKIIEDNLKKKGVKYIFTVFRKIKTIEFLLKNGFQFVPLDAFGDSDLPAFKYFSSNLFANTVHRKVDYNLAIDNLANRFPEKVIMVENNGRKNIVIHNDDVCLDKRVILLKKIT